MSPRIGSAAAGVLLMTSVAVRAAEQIVPLEEEPKHQLKFQNQHVRLFDVLLPPSYNSLWHAHVFDGVFVNIEPAETRAQDLGADPVDRAPRIVGETYFFDYGKKPKVHPSCGMLVSVSGGRLAVNAPGGTEQIALEPAGFKWRDQSAPLEIRNVGEDVFHAVDIVVK